MYEDDIVGSTLYEDDIVGSAVYGNDIVESGGDNIWQNRGGSQVQVQNGCRKRVVRKSHVHDPAEKGW